MKFEIYCDGSTRGNGQENAVGAWAYLVRNENGIFKTDYRAEANTTNQRMELMAAAEALDFIVYNHLVVPFDTIVVYTDSAYLHNCVKQGWYRNWQMNGWKNSKKQPVANQDLWERLIPYFEQPEIEFVKIKGHAGVEYNEQVDTMAQNASLQLKEQLSKEKGI